MKIVYGFSFISRRFSSAALCSHLEARIRYDNEKDWTNKNRAMTHNEAFRSRFICESHPWWFISGRGCALLIHSPSVFTQDIIIVLRNCCHFYPWILLSYGIRQSPRDHHLCVCVCVRAGPWKRWHEARRRKRRRNFSANKIIYFLGIPKSFYCLSKYYTKRNKWFVHGALALRRSRQLLAEKEKVLFVFMNFKWRRMGEQESFTSLRGAEKKFLLKINRGRFLLPYQTSCKKFALCDEGHLHEISFLRVGLEFKRRAGLRLPAFVLEEFFIRFAFLLLLAKGEVCQWIISHSYQVSSICDRCVLKHWILLSPLMPDHSRYIKVWNRISLEMFESVGNFSFFCSILTNLKNSWTKIWKLYNSDELKWNIFRKKFELNSKFQTFSNKASDFGWISYDKKCKIKVCFASRPENIDYGRSLFGEKYERYLVAYSDPHFQIARASIDSFLPV